MFGRRRQKPIELVAFTRAPPQTFNHWPCDGVTAHNVASFADLLALQAKLQAELSEVRVLSTLDDLDQACYTSGHAVDAHELDYGGEEDEETDEDAPSDFAARLTKLSTLARGIELDQIAGVLPWSGGEDPNDLVSINRNPEGTLQIAREKEIIFQYVPAVLAADTIAAFPNGYFSADLDPIQNHVLARHLERRYGLSLVALGSRFLAFHRSEPLDETTSHRISEELVALYVGTPGHAVGALAQVLTGKTTLLVRYTGS